MNWRPIILELGMGADIHGHDVTKAAVRAISDAIRHSSLTLFAGLKRHPRDMRLEVTVAVPRPDRVDIQKIKDALPFGSVEVTVVKGGIDDLGMGGMEDISVALVGVKAFLDVADHGITLSTT